MLRNKHLKSIMDIMKRHHISVEEIKEFSSSYKTVRQQLLEKREKKLAEQKNLLNLAKAREALANKRKEKENGK